MHAQSRMTEQRKIYLKDKWQSREKIEQDWGDPVWKKYAVKIHCQEDMICWSGQKWGQIGSHG